MALRLASTKPDVSRTTREGTFHWRHRTKTAIPKVSNISYIYVERTISNPKSHRKLEFSGGILVKKIWDCGKHRHFGFWPTHRRKRERIFLHSHPTAHVEGRKKEESDFASFHVCMCVYPTLSHISKYRHPVCSSLWWTTNTNNIQQHNVCHSRGNLEKLD